MTDKEKDYGPIWQLKQNLESKKSLIRSYSEDIARYEQKRATAMIELKQYEDVLNRLGESEE